MHDFEGKLVSEEEAAISLGFVDVFEMRRWYTEKGQEVSDLKTKLRHTEGDRDNFKYHLKRQQVVLEKCAEYFNKLQENEAFNNEFVSKLRLAIAVVSGKGVDWNHILKDWLE
jgi:hypothetical protein